MDLQLFFLLIAASAFGAFVGAILVYLLMLQASKGDEAGREVLIREYEGHIRELNERHQGEIREARVESVSSSRSALRGRMTEQVAPMLPGFDYQPADARFMGDPIDYVVFKGYSDLRDQDQSPEELEVVILDIKYGKAGLTKSQRAIAKAVQDGRVRFEVVRVFEDGTVKSHAWKARAGNNQKTP